MNGVTYGFDDDLINVNLTINPAELDKELDSTALFNEIRNTELGEVYLSRNTIKSACDKANHLFKTNDTTPVTESIGERRNAEVSFRIAEDDMQAVLSVTAPYGGQHPSLKAILSLAKKSGIVRGLGKRHIMNLLEKVKLADAGETIDAVVAKGLPPRDGHSSYMKPLVPNALDRVLRPQTNPDGKTDLRNLGDVICVKAKTPVVKRVSPSKGRVGYTIKGAPLEAKPGDWLPIKMGSGVEVSEEDENLLIASHSGMPKFLDLVMSVDDTYTCTGVNVGSGHVNYDGAVLVNGDVTEKMRVVATGDITINGFVESAYIEAGGDIIITEGAMGKESNDANSCSCILKAGGNIHVQHGQGLSINCGRNVSIGRQLAYSYIQCGGSVTVGQIDNPKGNLFACEIESQDVVIAGTLGAVSGSSLSVDFSDGFNRLVERIDIIEDLVKQLRDNNLRHKEKMDIIAQKAVPKEMLRRVNEAQELFENETAMLNWIEMKAIEMRAAKEQYQERIRIVATKKLYSGVTLKLNKRNWRSDREYDRSEVKFRDHQWHFEPLVS
ncbi:DUF342 domain-containing protein [Alteromonas sediminis]|uniref:DUF342 domain-containing protein n=1 Tax=Alteromonas sediminis TaxID=2259342 RepID=A0A3N5Y0P8_9ALTE|nr:FapA family protein [Alteromonas sediminis]RPJ67277.1 DUF342 domain-containing protein [Alteromonas sediminis]